MAEAMNYRMNLVIDPKNVIKANRELRAMERYFERIQGRVMRIGRTRMAPEIVLKDRASQGLDNLLAKINRVKSQVINASGNVKLHVHKQIDTFVSVNVQKQLEASLKLDLSQSFGQVDFAPLIGALGQNTEALNKLTSALGSLPTGGGGDNKSLLDKIIAGFGIMVSVGSTMRTGGELPKKLKGMRGTRGIEQPSDNPTGGVNKGRNVRTRGRRRGSPDSNPAPKTEQESKPATRMGKFLDKTAKRGDLIETVGTFGEGISKGLKFVLDTGKNLLGGGGSGIIAGGAGRAGTSGAGADPGKGAADGRSATRGGAASGLLKGAGRRLLGPLSFLADASAIASAEPGKERNQAIGSAVGGGIGASIGGAIGSVIPVAGTLAGSTLGGAVGSYVGEKIGGAVTGITETFKKGGEKVSKWFSKTFSFGKKEKDAAETKPVPKPAAPAASTPSSMIASPAPAITRPAYGPALPYAHSHSSSRGTFGPPAVDPARSQAYAGKQLSPQVVQISPEQMSALSGFLRDFKTETTTNYNLPPGAVQVTVHEEHPVDVEGLILQIGQRLRAEFMKASQNRKPTAPMPY